MPSLKFLGKRLLFITAHPDDESYAVAGTIIKNRRLKGKSFLICATLGEQGKAHVKNGVSSVRLKKIRRVELNQLCRFLKVDRVKLLNFPDTKLRERKVKLNKKLE